MRVVGMDIHRSFAQVATFEDGRVIQEGRVELVRERLLKFARSLKNDDEVVIEATGNSAAVERLLRPYVRRVVVANSRLVKAIAWARVKTDKVDAAILAKLHAGGLLPEVWVADDTTVARRRQIAERMGGRSRFKALRNDPEPLFLRPPATPNLCRLPTPISLPSQVSICLKWTPTLSPTLPSH
jgi:transposase